MRVQSPIAGAITGSAGRIIFQHYHSHTYGRAFPVIFHYQPTPAQYAAQTKFYGTRSYFNPIYRQLKPHFTRHQLAQFNPYNLLSEGFFKAMQTFPPHADGELVTRFGIDVYDRVTLHCGECTLYYDTPYWYLTLEDFSFESDIDFTPTLAHALLFCPARKQAQYLYTPFVDQHLCFPWLDCYNWFPDEYANLYVALSDDQHFTNFQF